MDNREITVVVQGPVHALHGRRQDEGITARCLRSVRELLPGARVVLSTWAKQNLEALDYDELVISEDPGPNHFGYSANGAPVAENTNRQIVSTVSGLRRVHTKYAMKLRADNYLTGTGFKDLQQSYPKRCAAFKFFRERVVVTNTFMRKYHHGRRVVFMLSDFFNFGLTEDVLDFWDGELFENFPFDGRRVGAKQHRGAPWPTIDVDQFLAQRFVNKHIQDAVQLRHFFDNRRDLVQKSNLLLANNFVVARAEEVGLGLPTKFTQGREAKLKTRVTVLSSEEWRLLYREHCAPQYPQKSFSRELVLLRFLRFVVMGAKWVGYQPRFLKSVWKHWRVSLRVRFRRR